MSNEAERDTKLLCLKNDYVFRKIFGDERNIDSLTAFIRATGCLGGEELLDLRIVDPQNLSDSVDGKDVTLDILARTMMNDSVHIEIQLLSVPGFDRRVIYYMARTLSNELRSGDEYPGLGRVISIVIVNWDMSAPDGRYHKVFHMRERESGEMFSDVLELHLMELKRLPRESEEDELFYWLKMISSERRDEMEMIASRSPELGRVYSRVVELSADERERLAAEAREKWLRDWASRLSGAREEGFENGLAKGMEKGMAKGMAKGMEKGQQKALFDTAQRMLNEGLPIELISKITNLPLDDIRLLAPLRGAIRNAEFGMRNEKPL